MYFFLLLTDHPGYPTSCPQKPNYQWTRTLASDLLKILSLQSVDVNLDASNRAAIQIPIGKKHALKKYDQFALNTSCFLGATLPQLNNFTKFLLQK